MLSPYATPYAPEASYTKLNTALITALSYTDAGLAAGATCYYALSAVDAGNDESVKSAPATVTPAAVQSPTAGSGGGGCFVSAAVSDLALDLFKPIGVLVALACLVCISRRRRGH